MQRLKTRIERQEAARPWLSLSQCDLDHHTVQLASRDERSIMQLLVGDSQLASIPACVITSWSEIDSSAARCFCISCYFERAAASDVYQSYFARSASAMIR